MGDGLDGGDLLSVLARGGKEVSSTGLLGGTLEVDLDSSLGGLGLGSFVVLLALQDFLLAFRLSNVLDADMDTLFDNSSIYMFLL